MTILLPCCLLRKNHNPPPTHTVFKEIYQKFGVNLDEYNGDDSWTLPLPARLIIDREGIIRPADISADYTIRPDPQETIAELKKIT